MKYKNPPSLTDKQFDTLKELINIGVGRAAGVLNEMTHSHVTLEVPYIKILSPSDLRNEMAGLTRDKIAAVQLNFKGPFSGVASLVFPPNSASMLVSVLTDEERWTSDMNLLKTGTLSEVGNIVINGVMGSICNVLKEHISFSMPTYMEDTVDNLLKIGFASIGSTALLAQTRFKIKKLQIEGDIILLFEVGSFDSLLAAIDTIAGGTA
ncbi:MAG: chemotaxis protein CheC [Nitrospirae bacterium]|nr:chemotaxis protein CheC [Nitrospirota bacterium]